MARKLGQVREAVVVAPTRVRRVFSGTRGRLTTVWIAIFFPTLVFANVGLYLAATLTASATIDAGLRDQAATVSGGLRTEQGKLVYSGGDLPHETSNGLLVNAAVVDEARVLLATPNQPLADSRLRSLASPVLQSDHPMLVNFTDSSQVRWRAYIAPVHSLNVVLVASTPVTDVYAAVTRTMVLGGLLSLAALVGSAALVHWLIGRALKPVSQIAQLAQSLSERELDRRVDIRVPDDEIGQLAKTFNHMLSRLEVSFNALRGFTADASHELRSPLAVMSTEVEYSLAKPRPPEEIARALRVVQDEVQHMSELVEKLLLLARADAGQLQPAVEELDATDFLHEVAARWERAAESKSVRLDVEVGDGGTLVADPNLTRRILDNLIENGIRHSPPEGRMLMSASEGSGGWLLVVRDQGLGIPAGHRAHMFERFGRFDPVRPRDGEGVAGLGLPISLAFARAQGGDLWLGEDEGWGAVLVLWLPDRASCPETP